MATLTARLGPLSEPSFARYFAGQLGSLLGDAMVYVAYAFAALQISGSPVAIGGVLAAYTLARIAAITIGGVWADRVSRRRLMIAADLARFASQALMGLALLSGQAQLWQLVLVAIVAATSASFFGPAAQGLVPRLISAPRLQSANALLDMARSGAYLLGPALSGLLIGLLNPGAVFVVDAATFALSAAAIASLHVDEPISPRTPFVSQLLAGWREVSSRAWLRTSLLGFALVNLGVAFFSVLGPTLAERALGGAIDWGMIMSAGAVGGLLGGAAALRWQPQHPLRAAFAAQLLATLPLVGLWLLPQLLGLAVLWAIGSAGLLAGNVFWNTALQRSIAPSHLSRVAAYDIGVSLALMPIGFALAGPLAAAFGLPAAAITGAGLLLAGNLLPLLVAATRDLRVEVAG